MKALKVSIPKKKNSRASFRIKGNLMQDSSKTDSSPFHVTFLVFDSHLTQTFCLARFGDFRSRGKDGVEAHSVASWLLRRR